VWIELSWHNSYTALIMFSFFKHVLTRASHSVYSYGLHINCSPQLLDQSSTVTFRFNLDSTFKIKRPVAVSGEHGYKSAHIKRGETLVRDEQMSVSQRTATLHDGESLTKWIVGQSGLDFKLQTGDIAANCSISPGKVEFSFR
jgi:hypothetical protein